MLDGGEHAMHSFSDGKTLAREPYFFRHTAGICRILRNPE